MDELTEVADQAHAQNGRQRSSDSTGPRTARGKSRASRNSTRHGVFSNLLLTEEPFREHLKDYNAVLDALVERYPAPDAIEMRMIEDLALDYMRLKRLYNLEAALLPDMYRRLRSAMSEEGPGVVTEVVDKQTEIAVRRNELDPELLLRYSADVRKSIEWHQEQLELLRNARGVKGPDSN